MTVGSLFSGIGGFDLGFERAGFEIKWQVEIDSYCQAVLAKHWPQVKRYSDVRECCANLLRTNEGRCAECGRADWLSCVDVICGGFPCQPVALGGRKLRQRDARWLWPDFARLIRELRPRYVVLENVPGLRTGGGMGDVLGDLAAIGYDAEWESIPASAVGAPHRRDRVWIVANSECLKRHTRAGEAITMDETPSDQLRGFSRFWEFESSVGRVVNGLPNRLDRLSGLGNAIVPQIAEWIARRILEVEEVMA